MKLLNLNVGIKINNSHSIVQYIKDINPDIIAFQEIIRHLDETVYQRFQSKSYIEKSLEKGYPFKFFGPLWTTEAIKIQNKIHLDFGGFIEQGNEFLSKYKIVRATNEHYYKEYSYAQDWTNWEKEDHGRALLIAEFETKKGNFQVLNLHGIWTKDKKGNKYTVAQCKYIINAALRKNIPTIITGDFNLLPETKSIKIIDDIFRNLIKDFNIKSTRPFSKKHAKNIHICDYIFINDLVHVNSFEVPNVDISDHLPLILDFDI